MMPQRLIVFFGQCLLPKKLRIFRLLMLQLGVYQRDYPP
ncbi:hypothetical protein SALBM135S_01853 [Streptomyces alboniger]